MTEKPYDLYSLTPFERWVVDEGLQVHTTLMLPDIYAIETHPWEKSGCSALLLDLTPAPIEGTLINVPGTSRYVVDIPPGGKFNAEHHMYEEIFYVLKGRGATSVWVEGGPKHTFEWKEGSVFSIPLNTTHEIYNGQGDTEARLYAATNAPTAFNMYASPDFIFNCPMQFPERFNPTDEQYFSGKANKLEDRYTETNFISDVNQVALDRWTARGPGANMMYLMAGGHFMCHVSEFPGGTYKKAHPQEFTPQRAGLVSSVAYLFLSGEGYDLQWAPGSNPTKGDRFERIDYGKGALVTPGIGYHQHFNPSPEPMRYVVLRFGNPRYQGSANARFRETGGTNMEFGDEPSAIRELFESEVAARNATSDMAQYAG